MALNCELSRVAVEVSKRIRPLRAEQHPPVNLILTPHALLTVRSQWSHELQPSFEKHRISGAAMSTSFISYHARKLAAMSIWAGAGAAAAVSCTDASAPIEAPPITAILSPASPTSTSGVVAGDVETIPAVFVHDANGRPLAGIVVSFRLTNSDGVLSTPKARTTAAGRASPAGWKLGTKAGEQVLIASVGSQTMMFIAIAVAGPAVKLSKVAGDNQEAARSTEVPTPLTVQLTDEYANPVAGMSVHFAVEAGGGSLIGETATTNSAGGATLGSWTLGLTPEQAVVASAGTLTPVTFRATAYDPDNPCTTSAKLNTSTVLKSTLTAEACHTNDGRFVDTYSVTLPEAGVWQFTLASNEFDTRLELRDEAGTLIASNRTDNSTTNSQIKAILPAGRMQVVVTSVAAGATGVYEVSYRATSGPDGCEISIARGVATHRNVLGGGPCTPKDSLSDDRYRIYLTAGSSLSVVLDDYSLADNRFELQSDDGATQAVGVIKNYIESKLDFTARVAGYYVILVRVYEEYSLTVR
jgi:hypothetical protein